MQKKPEAVFSGYLAQYVHEELVLIRGEIGLGELGGEFELSRSYLVMPGSQGKPQLGHLLLHLFHEGEHRGIDGAEVVILHLLGLGRKIPQKGAATEKDVRPLLGKILPDEKELLFGTHRGADPLDPPIAEKA